jgi:aminopeptidase YwaD
MTLAKLIACIIVSFTCVAARAAADDLGFVTIGSNQQLESARAMFDHAYLRVGQKFLVLAGDSQITRMPNEGLTFELVLLAADPSAYYVSYSSQLEPTPTIDKAAFSQPIELGDGVRLFETARSTATSLVEDAGLKVRKLDELDIPMFFEPVAVPLTVAAPQDYPTDSVANLVLQDSVLAWDSRLQSFYTRYYSTDSVLRARDWLVGKLQSWGYTNVSVQPFTAGGITNYNVRAVKLGAQEPDKIIVIGAHYDSYSGNALYHAPGADDNASGTTVVMEVARALKDIPLRKTVIFMPFSAEEIGLYGSQYAATDFRTGGANVEVMYNFDMVGFESNWDYVTNFQCGPNTAYRQLMIDAAARVSGIKPRLVTMASNSDHYPFYQRGFNIAYAAEGDGYPYYHTEQDSTSKLNFPYMTDIVRMAAATVAYTADAPHPTVIDSIVDQGNGNAVEVFWSDCRLDYQYTVQWGTSSGFYPNSIDVTPGACSQMITGLVEGELNYFSVIGRIVGGYLPAYTTETSSQSLILPRTPTRVAADPGAGRIDIHWASNHEADLDHYNIYRKPDFSGSFSLLASGLTNLQYADTQVIRWVTYDYVITAVDRDGFESPYSSQVQSTPATFDKGILVVDEMTKEYSFMPTKEHRLAYYDTVYGGTPHGVVTVDESALALKRATAGQYSSIFWHDDDVSIKLLRFSGDSLRWYLGNHTNMFICGYYTIPMFSPTQITPGTLLYDEFMAQGYTLNYPKDFVGAKGQAGWPSIQFDPTRGYVKMGEIPTLTARAGGQVIYTYDSNINDPAREDKPVGIAYDGPNGRRVILSFPLYYMTPASAQNLISAVKAFFHEAGQPTSDGDLNGDGFVDIQDLSQMIDFLFFSGPIPGGLNSADVDASCSVDISDLGCLVDYLFVNGPAPKAGCVAK